MKLTRRRVSALVGLSVCLLAAIILFAPIGPSIQLAKDIRLGTTREEAIELLGQPDSQFPIKQEGGTLLQWELFDGRVAIYFDVEGKSWAPLTSESSRLERWRANVRYKLGFF